MKELLGKPVAAVIAADIKGAVSGLADRGISTCLAIVRVGEDGSEKAYENRLVKNAERFGIEARRETLCGSASDDEIIKTIERLNGDGSVHGILLLQPLPPALDTDRIRNSIAQAKDVDCATDKSYAALVLGRKGFAPCTAEACIDIIKHYGVAVSGKRAVVIGRSRVVGKPLAHMLLAMNASVTVCHSRTAPDDLRDYCSRADIIISAVGRAGTIDRTMLSGRQTVIDVGINFDEAGRMTGDAVYQDLLEHAAAATPVPGGVGTVTSTLLFRHVIEAAEAAGRR